MSVNAVWVPGGKNVEMSRPKLPLATAVFMSCSALM
jgi:hypothetical protein